MRLNFLLFPRIVSVANNSGRKPLCQTICLTASDAIARKMHNEFNLETAIIETAPDKPFSSTRQFQQSAERLKPPLQLERLCLDYLLCESDGIV